MEHIKSIKSRIDINEYIIEFGYETVRHNNKTQKRKVSNISKVKAIRDFWLWIQCFNEENPYRKMLNVKILSIEKSKEVKTIIYEYK